MACPSCASLLRCGRAFPKRRMTTRQQLRLSYWRKWKDFGRFPWKLVLHALLLIASTTQIAYINTQDADYTRAAHRLWRFLYFPKDADATMPTADVYTLDETVDTVRRSLHNYFAVNNVSIDGFEYPSAEPSVPITVTSITNGRALREPSSMAPLETTTVRYTATPDDFALPLSSDNRTEVRRFFQSLYRMDLEFSLRGFAFGDVYRDCYSWHAVVSYDFQHRGHITMSMSDSKRESCNDRHYFKQFFPHWLWLDVIAIFLAIAYQALLLKAVAKRVKYFFRVKRKAKTLESIQRSLDGSLTPGPRRSPAERGAANDDLRAPLLGSGTPRAEGEVGSSKATEGDDEHWAYDRAIRGHTTPLSISTPREGRKASPTGSDRPLVGSFGADAPPLDANLGPQRVGKPPRPHRSRRRSKRNLERMAHSWGHGSMSAAARGEAAGEGAHQPSLSVLWSQLTWADKLRIFRFWFFIFTAGNLITVIASVADLTAPEPVDPTSRVLSGLGCALLWVGVLGYLEHDKRFYTLILTLRRGLPPIARFMVGVVPILLAYTFFGMVYFGDKTDRFGGFEMSLITLFAVLNGDVMRETFLVLLPYSPVVTQIYLYSFICLFIYVVLNVFIATIELAFFSTCVETLAHEGKEGGSSQGFYAAALPHTQPIADAAAAADTPTPPNPATAALQRRVDAAAGGRPRSATAVPPTSSAASTPRRGSQPFAAQSPQPQRAGKPQKEVDRLDLLLQETERLSLDSVAGSLSTGRMAEVRSMDDGVGSSSDSGSSTDGGENGTPETDQAPPSPAAEDGGNTGYDAAADVPAHIRTAMDREYQELLSSLASDLALGRAAPESGATDAERLERLQDAQRRGFATLRSIVRDAALRSPPSE